MTAPIVGSTRLSHLQDALGALSLSLSDDQITAPEAPYRPHPVLGHR